MRPKPRILRITTVPVSLHLLLKGQLSYMSSNGFDVLAVSSDGKEVEDILRAGIRHKVIRMTRRITPLRDLLSLMQLVILIKQYKPDIVHTHTPKAGLVGMMAAWICRVDVRMHTVAGLPLMEASGIKRKILLATESLTYQCATAVYPNSKKLREYIFQHIRISREKVRLIGKGSTNGIDVKYFCPLPELEKAAMLVRHQYRIDEETTVFCFVGRIVKDKGINELIDAFEKFDRGRFKLLLIGEYENALDPISDRCKELIERNPDIIATGFQADVRPFLMASDIFVFPSYREGFPNVVLQAAAMKIVSVVSNINGCNEIIQHNETGLIVEPKDTVALYEAMIDLSQNKPKRVAFAERARTFVESNFDQASVWEAIRNEYLMNLNRVY